MLSATTDLASFRNFIARIEILFICFCKIRTQSMHDSNYIVLNINQQLIPIIMFTEHTQFVNLVHVTLWCSMAVDHQTYVTSI